MFPGTCWSITCPATSAGTCSPDVFVVHGIANYLRDYYLVWEEGKGPDVAIELTSSLTRAEDTKKKFKLYQDVLKVSEYFLFDPKGDYLKPPLQGYRLTRGLYVPIRPVRDRLPSRILGLHLERSGDRLRLHDPAKGAWLPTRHERALEAEAKLFSCSSRGHSSASRRLRGLVALAIDPFNHVPPALHPAHAAHPGLSRAIPVKSPVPTSEIGAGSADRSSNSRCQAMSGAGICVLVFVGLVVVALFLVISVYNGLVVSRNRYKNAYAQIDVQLKRRYDLIPNLVECVKGYMAHEKGTLEAVVAARNAAMSAGQKAAANPGDPAAMKELGQAEAQLGGAWAGSLPSPRRIPT